MSTMPFVAWASTNKTKLEPLYCHQKHALRVINFFPRETHSAPLFLDIRALTIYQLNVLNILCLTYKCINKTSPKAFHNLTKKSHQININFEKKVYFLNLNVKQNSVNLVYLIEHLIFGMHL